MQLTSQSNTVHSSGKQRRRGDQALSCFADVEVLRPPGLFCARRLSVFARVASGDLRKYSVFQNSGYIYIYVYVSTAYHHCARVQGEPRSASETSSPRS